MNLSLHEIKFNDLKRSPLHWAESELRLENSVALYFLNFSCLPWTVALLCAPRNHIFGSVPRSSYAVGEIAVDVGPKQSAWTQSFFTDKSTIRQFRKELSAHKLTENDIPYGLLPFDGGLVSQSPIGFNTKERPLNNLWFRTYLIPQTNKSRVDLSSVLLDYLKEREIYFVRPFDDNDLSCIDWQSRFLGFDDHIDAILFRNYYDGFDSERLEKIQIEKLEFAVSELEQTNNWSYLSTSPNLDEFALQIAYPHSVVNYLKSFSAMNRGQRNVDIVNALRARLVHQLGWPIFIYSILTSRECATERFKKGPTVPIGNLPYDTVEEMDLFLTEMKEKYPSYWKTSWDDIWT